MKVSRASKLLGLPRSQFYYKSTKGDQPVIDALPKLAADHPVYGFRKLFAYLRRAGYTWMLWMQYVKVRGFDGGNALIELLY